MLQASRWDALKDMPGVMLGFAEHLVRIGRRASRPGRTRSQRRRRRSRGGPRARRLLARLAASSRTPSAGASIWPAYRWPTPTRRPRSSMRCNGTRRSSCRRAWPRASGSPSPRRCGRRPVVGSAVGGIVDQIVPGETGLLLDDPHDLAAFAERSPRLREPDGARPGANAREEPPPSSSAIDISSSGTKSSKAFAENADARTEVTMMKTVARLVSSGDGHARVPAGCAPARGRLDRVDVEAGASDHPRHDRV